MISELPPTALPGAASILRSRLSTTEGSRNAIRIRATSGAVTRASAENPSDASGAAYEVHVTKSDGSQVEVLEDSAFKVLSVNPSTGHGPGPGH